MCTGIEIALVVGAVASAGAAVAQGEAQARAAEFNAATQRQAAEREREIAARDAEEFARSADRQIAKTRALFSTSGVQITGTPLGVIEDTAAEAAFEELNILAGGETRAQGLERQAKLNKRRAGDARTGGLLRGGATLATGATELFGGFGQPASVVPIAPSTESFVAGQLE